MARRQEIGVGVLLLAGIVATALLALQIGALSSFGERIVVRTAATDVAGLQRGYPVSALGVQVGTVDRITLDGSTAWVYLSIDPQYALRTDARPSVRAQSLLGEKYVALEPIPGSVAPLLTDGAELGVMAPQFEVDELVDVLGPLVASISPADAKGVLEAVNEIHQQDPERFARMIDDLEVVLANARLASVELPGLVSDARMTLAHARNTLSVVDSRAIEAQTTIKRADTLLAKLEGAAEPLPETIAEAKAALADARALIQKLDGATDGLDEAIAALDGLSPERIESMLRDEGIRVRFGARDKSGGDPAADKR